VPAKDFFKLEILHFVQDAGVEAQGDGQGAGDREYGAPKLKLALDGFVFWARLVYRRASPANRTGASGAFMSRARPTNTGWTQP
jgi:hypothetical protein